MKQKTFWLRVLALLFLNILAGCSGSRQETAPIRENCDDVGGVLEGTECVEKDVCTQDSQCFLGKKCLESKCHEKNYCLQTSDCLQAGLAGHRCETSTKTCVPLKECNPDGTCDNNYTCIAGNICVNNDDVCNALNCGTAENPGLCLPSKSTEKCVNASTCNASRPTYTQCAKGFFCDGIDQQCKENKCADGDYCTNGGVCPDKTKNECQNKEDCQKSEDCLPDHVCVKHENGPNKCQPTTNQEAFCKEYCSGNQICSCNGKVCTKETAQQPANVICALNTTDGCTNALDCRLNGNDDIICGEPDSPGTPSKCRPPAEVACLDDGYENGSHDKALKNRFGSFLFALCQGKDDWFSFDLLQKGSIYVALYLDSKDLGNKPVTISLYKKDTYDPSNPTPIAEIKEVTDKQIIQVATTKEEEAGEYLIKVSTPATPENLARLRYRIYAEPISAATLDQCQAPATLQPTTPSTLLTSHTPDLFYQATSSPSSHTGATPISCYATIGTHNQDVWHLHVPKRRYYTFEVAPIDADANTDVAFAIRRSCEITESNISNGCVNEHTTEREEKLQQILEPGDYYIIANGKYNAVRLQVAAYEVTCIPERDTKCENNQETICNPEGTGKITRACSSGCDLTTNRCQTTQGNTCASPIIAEFTQENDFTFHQKVGLAPFENTYHLPANKCGMIDTKDRTSGEDIVVQVTLEPGERLVAEARAEYGLAAIYITEDCSTLNTNPHCAEASYVASGFGGPITSLVFEHPSVMGAKTYYIIIDYDKVQNEATLLEYSIKKFKPVCEPNKSRCIVKGRQSELCSKYGDKAERVQTCSMGCDEQSGECKTPPSNKCEKKNPIMERVQTDPLKPQTPDTVSANYNLRGTNNTQPLPHVQFPATCPYPGFNVPKEAHDLAIYLPTDQGYSYEIEVNSDFDAILWMSDSCDTTTGVVGSCFGLTDNGSTQEKYSFYSEEEKDHWIIVEPFNSGVVSGSFDITVKRKQSGTPFTRGACEGDKAIWYDAVGEKQEVDCGVGKCQDDSSNISSCQEDVNDYSCLSPKVVYPDPHNTSAKSGAVPNIASTATLKKHMRDYTQETAYGGCYFNPNAPPQGVDGVFQFTLQPNETVQVDFLSHTAFQAKITAFFQTTCGDSNSCVYAFNNRQDDSDISNDTPLKLSYKNRSTTDEETVYLIVRQTGGNNYYDQFSFKWKIDSTLSCPPYTYACDTSNHVTYCNESGELKTYATACATGCTHGFCSLPTTKTGESCDQAIVIRENTTPDDTFEQRYLMKFDSIQQSPNHSEISCTKGTNQFRDVFFEIYLKENQILDVETMSLGEETGATLYVVEGGANCAKTITEEDSCLAKKGVSSSGRYATALRYKAKKDAKYLVGFSHSDEDAKHPFLFDFKVTPMPQKCKDNPSYTGCDSGNVEYCDQDGLLALYNCPSSDCNAGSKGAQCGSSPSGASCFDAIPLTKGHLYNETTINTRLDIKNFITPSYPNIYNSCLFTDISSGFSSQFYHKKERFYSIELQANDLLEATLTPGGDSYFYIYIVEGCAVGKQKCLVSSTRYLATTAAKTISFVAPEAGTYYIVVEDLSSTPSPTFTLLPKVTPGSSICAHSPTGWRASCLNNTATQCLSDGTKYTYACDCDGVLCKEEKTKTAQRDKCEDVLKDTFIPDLSKDSQGQSSAKTKGIHAIIPMNQMTHDLAVLTQDCGVTSPSSTTGRKGGMPDAFYKVILPAGGTLRAKWREASATFYAGHHFLFFLRNKCESSACVAGKHYKPEVLIELRDALSYTNKTQNDETIIVGVSGIKAGDDDKLVASHLFLEVDLPSCTPGEMIGCKDSDTLLYCNSSGFPEEYTCSGSSTTKCTGGVTDLNAHCTDPTNNVCHDRATYTLSASTPTMTIQGSFDGAENHTNLKGYPNTCTKNITHGPEQLYKVVVPKDKKLTVQATSKSSTPAEFIDLAIYAVESCTNRTDLSTCLAGADEERQYVEGDENTAAKETFSIGPFTEDKTITLVVESFYPTPASNEFTVTLELSN